MAYRRRGARTRFTRRARPRTTRFKIRSAVRSIKRKNFATRVTRAIKPRVEIKQHEKYFGVVDIEGAGLTKPAVSQPQGAWLAIDPYTAFADIAQGTSKVERIGNQITIKSAYLYFGIQARDLGVQYLTNFSPPFYVHVLVGRYRPTPSTPNAGVQRLAYNPESNTYGVVDGDPGTQQLKLTFNRDEWSILRHKKFLLRPGLTELLTNASHADDVTSLANPQQSGRSHVQGRLRLPMPRTLKYSAADSASTAGSPAGANPFGVWAWVSAYNGFNLDRATKYANIYYKSCINFSDM